MAEKAAAPQQLTEADVRELMMRGDQLRQQLAALETQREYVLELVADARRSLSTLEHLTTAKEGDEVLVPLGAGVFAQARLADPGKALASLGSGLHAELPTSDARARIQARVESLEAATNGLTKDIGRVTDEIGRLNAVAEEYLGG